MNTLHTNPEPVVTRRKFSIQIFPRWCIIFLIFAITTVVFLVTGLLIRHRSFQAEFAKEVKIIRDAGEPLDGNDLNAFYHISKGNADLTADYIRLYEEIDQFKQHLGESNKPKLETSPAGTTSFGTSNTINTRLDFPNCINRIPTPNKAWEQRGEAEAFLQEHQCLISNLHSLLAHDGEVRFPIDFRHTIDNPILRHDQLLYAAYLLLLECSVYLHQGDYEKSSESLAAIAKLTRAIRNEPTLDSDMRMNQIIGRMLLKLPEYLEYCQASDDDLLKIQDALSQVDFLRQMQRTFLGLRAFTYEASQREVLDMGNPRPHQSLNSNSLNYSWAATRPGDCALALRLHTKSVMLSKQPIPDNFKNLTRNFDEVEMRKHYQKLLNWQKPQFTATVLPSFDAIALITTKSINYQRCGLIAIAIKRFELRYGRLPEQLSLLEPDFIEKIPEDSFFGKPLFYKVRANSFTVYAIGYNQVDDGGAVDDDPTDPSDIGLTVGRRTFR